MINQQLTDYINQNRKNGATDEQIRQTLSASGWSVQDIQAAMGIGKDIAPSNKADYTTAQKGRKLPKKIIFIIAVIILLILISISAFWYFRIFKVNKHAELPSVSQGDNQASTTSNPDIDRVRVILEDIRQGNLTNNKDLILKHSSIETASSFSASAWEVESFTSFIVNSVSQVGQNIVANITTVSKGNSDTSDFVFIKEGGEWKFDFAATWQYALDQAKAKKDADDPNGLPDLVVTSVTVFPSHPIVNDKDVEITINVKNIGTKTSDDGVSFITTLLGFKGEVPDSGSIGSAIYPGETTRFTFNPYMFNDVFKIRDTAGQKTIQVVLNKSRNIVESNYDNNVFTQSMTVYDK